MSLQINDVNFYTIKASKKYARKLEDEGVQFANGKVVPVDPNDDKNLDALLWGPELVKQKLG